MAIWFVYSGAAGLNNGTSWANAWTDLASAVGVAAGDIIKIHKTHAQAPGANTTLIFTNGTIAAPVQLICVDKDASDALATGAIYGPTGANSLNLQGHIYCDGITFRAGSTLTIAGNNDNYQVFENCILRHSGGTSISLSGGSGRQDVQLINTTLDFSTATAAGVSFSISTARLRMLGGTISLRATQTTAINVPGASQLEFLGVQFSGTVTNILSVGSVQSQIILRDCNLPTFTNQVTGSPTNNQNRWIRFERCVGGTITVPEAGLSYYSDRTGSIAGDLAHYRTGGADDGANANPHSWAMTTSANSGNLTTPLMTPNITRWVDAGSQTITVYVASGVTLKDDECWIEVFSPSEAASATAQAAYRSTRANPLATPAALTTDGTSTWNGAGVGTKQKMSVTIAPTIAGPVLVHVNLAKASTTIYVDPVIDVAGDVAGESRFIDGAEQFAATSAASVPNRGINTGSRL